MTSFNGVRLAPLGGRRRFVTLDAMRGVAAISVMLFHYLHFTPYRIFDHAFYAVDFFFILSGIVLLHSYGDKITIGGMSFKEFCRIRLIQLYPLYLTGLILGIASLPVINGFSAVSYILSAIGNLLLLPFPNEADVPFVNGHTMIGALFPYNIPAWSLFFELLASLGLYALVRYRIKPLLVFNFAFWGTVAFVWHFRTLNVGWATDDFLGGLPRTAAAFTFGMMMYWSSTVYRFRFHVPPVITLGLLTVLFMVPFSQALGLASCAICIPILIYLGLAADPVREKQAPLIWLGRVSYGIYVIHLPIYHLLVPVLVHTPIGYHQFTMAPCLVAIVLVTAHLLTALVDEPLRRRLTRQFVGV